MHCTPQMLSTSSLCAGALALSSITLALATHNWLRTSEMTKPVYNDTNDDVIEDDDQDSTTQNFTDEVYVPVEFEIGLWRSCLKRVGFDPISNVQVCINLRYFQPREKDENQETSLAIAEAQRGATPVFITSFLFVLAATVFHVVGIVKANSKALIAGILYINGGLCIAVGMVLYITFVNDEAHFASKDNEWYYFQYSYDWSAYLLIVAFLASQLAAVLCITLHLHRHSNYTDIVKIIPGLEKKTKVFFNEPYSSDCTVIL